MGKHLRTFLSLTFLSFAIFFSTPMWAQDSAPVTPVTVPHVVQYAGTVTNSSSTAVTMKFALYATQTGGEPSDAPNIGDFLPEMHLQAD